MRPGAYALTPGGEGVVVKVGELRVLVRLHRHRDRPGYYGEVYDLNDVKLVGS